jgi:hypothetical protein
MKRVRFSMSVPAVLLCLAASLLFTGCATIMPSSTVDSEIDTSSSSSLPPVSGFADDIKDVSIPADMEWQRDKSMSVKTESYRGGVWVYTGNVEAISLKDFMTSSMLGNNWRMVGEAISADIMLAFVKPGKTCMMIISEIGFNKTVLTLYITIDKVNISEPNPFALSR